MAALSITLGLFALACGWGMKVPRLYAPDDPSMNDIFERQAEIDQGSHLEVILIPKAGR